MAVSAIKAFVTMEGRQIIIDALDRTLHHPSNTEDYKIFQIKSARLGYDGDDARDIINESAADFQARWDITPGVDLSAYSIGNGNGFLNITHYKLPGGDGNIIEFYVCVPPGENLDITDCNELMIYADSDPTTQGTAGVDETGFIYAIFPEITKLENEGLQFRVTLEL